MLGVTPEIVVEVALFGDSGDAGLGVEDGEQAIVDSDLTIRP